MSGPVGDGPRVFAKVAADLLHPGHLRFFQAARALGCHLTIGVVPDERVIAYKGSPLLFSHAERIEMIAGLKWVDAVDPEPPRMITLKFLDTHGYGIYAFGASDEHELDRRLADCPDVPTERLALLPYTPGYSSRTLKKRLCQASGSERESLQREAERTLIVTESESSGND